jgi:hypothetical protein
MLEAAFSKTLSEAMLQFLWALAQALAKSNEEITKSCR